MTLQQRLEAAARILRETLAAVDAGPDNASPADTLRDGVTEALEVLEDDG